MIFSRKMNNMTQFYTKIAHKMYKMTECYVIFARKTFFPNFGETYPLAPVSYAYMIRQKEFWF